MIALGKGICSDELVIVGHPYLVRIGDRYVVIVPIDPTGAPRQELPYLEAAFIDPMDQRQRPFSDICSIHAIY